MTLAAAWTPWDSMFLGQLIGIGLVVGIGLIMVSVWSLRIEFKPRIRERCGPLVYIGSLFIALGFGWLIFGGFDWALSLVATTPFVAT